MGKFFVILIFALCLGGVVAHFIPATASGFQVAQYHISYMVLIVGGFMFGGYKLTGK